MVEENQLRHKEDKVICILGSNRTYQYLALSASVIRSVSSIPLNKSWWNFIMGTLVTIYHSKVIPSDSFGHIGPPLCLRPYKHAFMHFSTHR